MATTTISAPVTVVTNTLAKYTEYLTSLQANNLLTNVVGDEANLTITFNYSTTVTE